MERKIMLKIKNSPLSKCGKKSIVTLSLIFLALVASNPALFAQSEQAGTPPSEENMPKVFIDCEMCDIASIREQIRFVDHVQDMGEAQVAVLITTQETESGGTEYTLSFRGQKGFQGDDDTLRFEVEKEEESTKGLTDTLKMGLMRYVGKTPVSDKISIRFIDTVKPTDVEDKWNFWVFSISGNTFLNGQQQMKGGSYYGSFSASRVTEELKIRMSVNAMYSKDIFNFDDIELESKSNSQSFSGMIVKSISEHFSIGAYLSGLSSTYENIQYGIKIAPAVEINLFPYSESTKREFRLLYTLGYNMVKYREETIYEKTFENLWKQNLSAILEIKQKWGTASASLTGSNYFHDFSKNRLRFSADLSLRLIKGLNFNIDGSYSLIHDQLSLPRMDASLDEVLLQRRELETNYSYRFSVGISYTFGSTQSNVVNPRFGDSGGGISISL
jgi:hypothetical protein